jgi:hypothetical protein
LCAVKNKNRLYNIKMGIKRENLTGKMKRPPDERDKKEHK